MITKNDIIKMAKHIVRRGKGRSDGRIMHPMRDWFVGLLVAVALFFAGVMYAGFVFYSAWQYNPDTFEVDVEVVAYEKNLIREVTEAYESREQAFRALRRDPVPIGTTTPETGDVAVEVETENEAAQEVAEGASTDGDVQLAN